MEQFFALFLISITIEGTVTYIRTWFVDNHFQWQQAAACVLGILLAIAYKLDYISLFDVKTTVPYVGNILTGIAISRGSNYLFDLLKRIMNYKSELTVADIQEEEMKG